MFRIGDFSKICRVPVSALRYYADLGLLEPAHIDRFTGYRYYSLDQLPRLNRILALKDLGLSLAQIGQLLNDDVSPEEIRGMLRLKQAEIQQQVQEEQARLARVEARLRLIQQEGKMPEKEVVLKQIESQMVISRREIVPTPEHVGLLIGELAMAVMRQGGEFTGPPMSIFYDEEFKPTNLDVEVAFPVAKGSKGVALDAGREASTQELPAVAQAASIIHNGDYDGFTETYSVIGHWISENGYRIVGPPREIYLHYSEDNTAENITEIQFPVERA